MTNHGNHNKDENEPSKSNSNQSTTAAAAAAFVVVVVVDNVVIASSSNRFSSIFNKKSAFLVDVCHPVLLFYCIVTSVVYLFNIRLPRVIPQIPVQDSVVNVAFILFLYVPWARHRIAAFILYVR